jgi:hypothetical protein
MLHAILRPIGVPSDIKFDSESLTRILSFSIKPVVHLSLSDSATSSLPILSSQIFIYHACFIEVYIKILTPDVYHFRTKNFFFTRLSNQFSSDKRAMVITTIFFKIQDQEEKPL